MPVENCPSVEEVEAEKQRIKEENLRAMMNGGKVKPAFHGSGGTLKPKAKRNSRAYHGTYAVPNSTRWAAQWRCKLKKHYLGSFDTEVEAARAYDAALIKFGDPDWRKKANFPDEINEAARLEYYAQQSRPAR